MPGTVVSIHKSAGNIISRGDALLTIESMKLQMALSAPRDGVVAEILRQEGERFDKDDIVARLVDKNRNG
jgi:biotin carboxyl carrier protein